MGYGWNIGWHPVINCGWFENPRTKWRFLAEKVIARNGGCSIATIIGGYWWSCCTMLYLTTMGKPQNPLVYMAVCQNLVPLVNIKIAGKWMFIPLKMVLIGIDPYPYDFPYLNSHLLWPPGGHLVTPQRRGHRWHQQMPLILHNETVLKAQIKLYNIIQPHKNT